MVFNLGHPLPLVTSPHLPNFTADDTTAAAYAVRTDQLPQRGLGFEIGAHVYPLRGRKVTLGVGASLLRARGRKAPAEDAPATLRA